MVKLQEPDKAKNIFGDWQETIIWSALKGVMGSVYADREDDIHSAAAVLGDFCFLAGVPCEELISSARMWAEQNFIIMVPQNEKWGEMIENTLKDRAVQVTRYAMKKEGDVFDREKLRKAVKSLPKGFELMPIDEKLYDYCKTQEWSKDLVSQFADYPVYHKLGIGVVALYQGEPAAGASSYSRYLTGIEIEIDTKEEYRRRGLAYACGAQLILNCLDRGLYPGWDAQNLKSRALAEKLGYTFDYAYKAYECIFNPSRPSTPNSFAS